MWDRDYWASVSEPHTSALNVELFLYGTYIQGLYIAADAASSAGHSYHVPLLAPREHIVLPHSVSFIEQVCPTVRPHLNDADRVRGKKDGR